MGIAFCFPGQGSIEVGMGTALLKRWPSVKQVYQEASDLAGVDLIDLVGSGTLDRLVQTDVAHLVIFTQSIATAKVLEEHGMVPSVVSGHSLGEWTAAVVSGSLGFAEGLTLVRDRGRWLREDCEREAGGMVAVSGLSLDELQETGLHESGSSSLVANVNGRCSVVLSGGISELATLRQKLKGSGAAFRPLDVHGAFHSPLMRVAAEKFTARLAGIEFRIPRIPWVSSMTGELMSEPSRIHRRMKDQILHPVRWDLVLKELDRRGCGVLAEVGPGRVLSGLSLRWHRRWKVHWTDRPAAVEKLLRVEGASGGESSQLAEERRHP